MTKSARLTLFQSQCISVRHPISTEALKSSEEDTLRQTHPWTIAGSNDSPPNLCLCKFQRRVLEQLLEECTPQCPDLLFQRFL